MRRSAARAALLAALVTTTGLAHPSTVRADGDPASDVLLGEGVFYPYNPPVRAATVRALNTVTAEAAAEHFPLKVALIASPVDLGVIPDLFGKPQRYAQFLDQEISYQTRQPLLVVMATGYGVQGLTPAAVAAVRALPRPASGRSDALAEAALLAVPRIARAAGHPLHPQARAHPAAAAGGSNRLVLLGALAGGALLVSAALLALRHRAGRGA